MPVDKSWIGRKGGQARIVVERSPVGIFAKAVKSTDPVFQDERAAKEAGLDRIPAPPTFLMSAGYVGMFPEQQPDKVDPSPQGDAAMTFVKEGALLLHGEQAFTFARPVYVGDVLDSETTVVDVYEKQGGSGTMTFVSTDTVYTDVQTGDVVVTARATLIGRK